jgi:hypothetical protein
MELADKEVSNLNVNEVSNLNVKEVSNLNVKEVSELRNLIKVTDIIRRTENPTPFMTLFIILIIVTVMYFIYINFIKKTITGIWLDENDKTHNILHNKWKDTIIIDRKYHGLCKGHIVIVYMDDKIQMGIWAADNIKWTDGSTWNCSYGY